MIRPWFKHHTGKLTLAKILPLIERRFNTDYWIMPLGNWSIIVAHGTKRPKAKADLADYVADGGNALPEDSPCD